MTVVTADGRHKMDKPKRFLLLQSQNTMKSDEIEIMHELSRPGRKK